MARLIGDRQHRLRVALLDLEQECGPQELRVARPQQAVAAAAVLTLFVVAWLGANWAARFQFVIMAVLFVAIAGPNHDGHAYLERAARAGASGVVVAKGRDLPPGLGGELPVLAADDTIGALGRLGAGHRRGFDGPVVAITGSNGKTTTKEMCAAILSVGASTLKNRGNLNNQFGLPLTLLAREPRHRRVVVELGMNHRGEIAELARIAQPGVGVVTNVGTAHIEYLGSRDEIAQEKGDLLAALPARGTAVVLLLFGLMPGGWQGWFLWVILPFVFGLKHPPPLNDHTPLDQRRKLVGLGMIAIFVLVFTPVPFRLILPS